MVSEISVPAAERTLRLIELVLTHPSGMTPQDFLSSLKMSRSALFDLLRTLKMLGYLEQVEERGSYKIGPRLKVWHSSFQFDPQDLLTAFYQEIVSSSIDETIVLAIPNRGEVTILAQVESAHRVRSVYKTGENCNMVTSPAAIVLQNAPGVDIQSQGFALCTTEELIEIAMPVCGDGHHPNAALMITAPNYRQTTQSMSKYLPACRELAARLSYRIGALLYEPFQEEEHPLISSIVPLSVNEINSFLTGPRTARLACVRPDGLPHVVPIWHVWDGSNFYLIAWKGSLWSEYLLLNPHISLIIDEPWPPLQRVIIRGTARSIASEELPGGLNGFLDGLSKRYLGQVKSLGLENQVEKAFKIEVSSMSGRKSRQRGGRGSEC